MTTWWAWWRKRHGCGEMCSEVRGLSQPHQGGAHEEGAACTWARARFKCKWQWGEASSPSESCTVSKAKLAQTQKQTSPQPGWADICFMSSSARTLPSFWEVALPRGALQPKSSSGWQAILQRVLPSLLLVLSHKSLPADIKRCASPATWGEENKRHACQGSSAPDKDIRILLNPSAATEM